MYEIQELSDELLRLELEKNSYKPGPITDSTRYLYQKKLYNLKTNNYLQLDKSKNLESNFNTVINKRCVRYYSQELEYIINSNKSILTFEHHPDLIKYCDKLFGKIHNNISYNLPSYNKSKKIYFNYILLDPNKTTKIVTMKCLKQNISKDQLNLNVFKEFLGAIFYIGKGSQIRPYSHLIEALNTLKCTVNTSKETLEKEKTIYIKKIWEEGLGIISLHIFHNLPSNDALTREASMIDAIGKSNLTNQKRGTYYGEIQEWPQTKKCVLGSYLLYKAFQIYICEGETQMKPQDL
ncbi:ankyrin repeat and LEM domain-containing protein 1-like [Gordionus sp. m RMFG-2023]|uniref:ankyrin repeat and LEM domain-containing protein 1-like n=1 Tax=Gordionus sp. m RMFG-2023 TaxID=3053472 RepID=UPI0031FDAD45